ncbi:MAG: hypothetical protein A2622_02675 [Bdellovibrionales bacterium RIFCSPHIGHO2_01_FULL_40_29]|nr:MAG: hypothetical protein A2622_02675 [Bdellovibrionales bacterium RIFCSPHIGHO2_01_FULL_40_29]OFZ33984.1 MAG: hypothetical protein A3D17_03095 [Bdellovibrionales bacterium RIFCSPHIGHO2_02_FULL_40_15]
MYQRSETFFAGHDGSKLFLQKWTKKSATGTILITHGHGEHSESYHRLISGFENEDWNFIAWDLRGHGKSEGLRGFARDFDDYILDYHSFIEKTLNLPEVIDKPIILLAHSMGALIQTCALLEKDYPSTYKNIKAQVLSSPFFGVAFEVPKWKDSGAVLLNNLFPKLTLNNELHNDQLTRDPLVIREYETDTYRHHKMSSGVYLGFKREFPKVLARASEIKLPTLMHISDNDPVVSSEAALKIFDAFSATKKGLKIIDGGKHELYNDTVRNDIFKIVIEFVNQFKK